MRITSKLLVPVLAMSSLAVLTLPVLAEPIACKGLAQAECTAKAPACKWVNGYKTVAGVDTKSYCRRSTAKAK